MEPYSYRGARLHAEGVALADIARAVGTPCYVYSRAAIEQRFRAFDRAFGERDHLVCYSVKANFNLAVLNLLARLGSGFDIVSGGELERVLRAGGDPARVVFSGVGKNEAELRRALEVGIHCFNVESEPELERLSDVAARLGRRAPVSLRVNPDVDPGTHPYIATGLKDSKFGVPMAAARELYVRALEMAHVEVIGVDCHIGSQLTALTPFADALERLLALVDELVRCGVTLRHIDLGGGLGIRYRDEHPPEPSEYVAHLLAKLDALDGRYRHLRILIEPGRAIVGPAGALLTRILYLKHGGARDFAVVDAGMNDLLRPALYDAWQEIVPVLRRREGAGRRYDVVGPVCESADVLGRGRELCLQPDDLLAVLAAGAYGAAMSSNYNSRPRGAEVMVDGERFHVVRRRETAEELWRAESVLPG
jgi:diaminopimelate decarboxylase